MFASSIEHHRQGSTIILLLLAVLLSPLISATRPAPRPADDAEAKIERENAIRELVKSPALDSLNFSLLVTEIPSGKVVAEYESARPLIPASIMKSLTIATLSHKLNPDWRYRTPVYLEGNLKRGVLNGNLVIEGSGDPTVNSRCAPESPDFIREIVEELKNAGIDSISGCIIIDDTIFNGPSTPPTWGTGDLSHSYGTGSHGFNFENNSRGKSAVFNPEKVFETGLCAELRNAGIKLGRNETPKERQKRKRLMVHVSPPLEEIMRSCMMRSDNLFAECFLRTYSVERGADGSTADGAKKEAEYWAGKKKPMEGVVIIDGSGLARGNRLTALFLSEVLREMSENVEYASYFPLAGQEGTLRKFLKGTDLDSYLAMKTGSMTGIQCYAGYLLDEDFAPTHTVVVMANKMKDRAGFRTALGEALQKILK